MTEDRAFEREVTIGMASIYLLHPQAAQRVSHDELRRIVAEELVAGRRPQIPDVFRDAFGEDASKPPVIDPEA